MFKQIQCFCAVEELPLPAGGNVDVDVDVVNALAVVVLEVVLLEGDHRRDPLRASSWIAS